MHDLLIQTKYDHKETESLVNGFSEGFTIGYGGDQDVQQTAPNLKLEVGSKLELWDKIMKEVELKRFAGPFPHIPFQNFIQSPVGLVPKGEDGVQTRLIFHLSYPRGGWSVNSETPRELCTVQYKELDFAIAMCLAEGRGCFIAKSDFKLAFRNLPIKLKDWRWLVLFAYHPITNQKFFFIDKCSPFGASISCAHFQSFSNAIAHIFKFKTGKDTDNYLDDFLFVVLLKAMCNGQVEVFLQICKTVNFPIALDKTFWGTQILVFLGIMISTILQTVSVPEAKVKKAIF